MKRAPLIAALAGLTLSCSAIGDPGGMPDGLPHGGTGQFRLLDAEESGISGLPGIALFVRNVAIESAMRADGFLFHTHQARVDEPPTPPDDYPENEVFQDAFGLRSIYRAPRFEEGTGAFAAGAQVLAASEAWEGEEVFDPWVLVEDDGTARLYYAAAGGIGVATASSVDGAFTKEPGPIVDSGRRPTVVRGPDDAYWMYYDTGDGIAAARSEDGVSFAAMSFGVTGPDDVDDSREVRLASPGAARVDTRGGRTIIRLYAESVRDDGSHLVYLLGSEDGESFDRFPRPVIDQPDVRHPAPHIVDDRVTFLYANFPNVAGGFQTRAVTVSVAPAGESFAVEEESM